MIEKQVSRQAEAQRVLELHPGRIPTICTKDERSDLPELPRQKFLVPRSMLCGEFKYIIHKHLMQKDPDFPVDLTVYLFANGRANPRASASMLEIYDKYKSEDGFLYLTYSCENTLGT